MSNYTTEDCKKFLAEQYPDTVEKKWKRTKKYKDESGIVCRDFSYGVQYSVTLQETKHGLIEKQDIGYIIDHNLPHHYQHISLNQMLFGGGSSTVKSSAQHEEKFLHVLEHGINWEATEGNRSSFDFSKHIDFVKFSKECEDKGINLAEKFLDHAYSCVTFILELDETYIPHHIATPSFDDSYIDLIEIQKKIELGYSKNNLTIKLSKETINGLLSTIEDSRDISGLNEADDEEDDYCETGISAGECNQIMNDLAKLYKKHLTKSLKP